MCVCVCERGCMCVLRVFTQSSVDEWAPSPPWPPCLFTVCIHSSVIKCTRGAHARACFKVSARVFFEPRVFTCVQEVFFVCSRHACIGLHADRFVIRGNHFGRALTPFLSGHDSRPKSILIV